jgi:hypothetical protein
MTEPNASRPPNLSLLKQPLDFAHRYPCPVCRHGHIEGLFLVDAFSCGFCRHVFTLDSTHQHLCLEDTAQLLQWRWTGDRWVSSRSVLTEDSRLLLWGLSIALVLLPTAMIWLFNYILPPLPSQDGTSFPLLWTGLTLFPSLWTGLTFLSHASIVGLFCLEYYQIPVYLILKLYAQRLFQPLLSS